MAAVFTTLVVGIAPTTAVVIIGKESRSDSRNPFSTLEPKAKMRIIIAVAVSGSFAGCIR
jgi:hypothetical protein